MKRSAKKYKWNEWRIIAACSLGIIWLVIPLWLITAQNETNQNSVTDKVQIFDGSDDDFSPESLVTLLPYASDFQYQILQPTAITAAGFEQPAYDDSNWAQSASTLGATPGCAPPTLRPDQAVNTRRLIRKKFTVPPGATNVRVTYIVDNDMENFWFNGTLVKQNQNNNNCPELDSHTVTIPNNLLVAGENTLAFQTLDRGQQTYFDVKVVAIVANTPSEQCAIISPTPVAWWNGQNNANDVVNGHNGYALNGVQYDAGKVGQSFSFNGVSKISIPTNTNLHANVFSLSVWVYPTQLDTFLTNVASRGGSYGIYLQQNGTLAYYIRGVNGMPAEIGSSTGYTNGGATIPLNQWTHIMITYDGSFARSYTNGILRRTIVGVTGNVTNSNDAFTIGGGLYYGNIDEVQYFNRALSNAEVTSITAADNAGICPPPPRPTPSCVGAPTNLISLWKGEENVNDVAGGNLGYAGNTITYTQGKVGQSFNFDGTDSVRIPTYSILSQQQFTLGTWIYPTEHNSFLTNVVSRGNSYGIYLKDDGTLAFYIRGVNGMPAEIGSSTGFTSGGVTIPLNQWTHVAFTYDGAKAKSYINGRLARTINGVIGVVTNSNDPLTIGGGAYNGKIDEILFAGRALSESELTAIVDADSQGICALPPSPTPTCSTPPLNFVSWWRGEGNANDAQGSNNGAATNTVTYPFGKVGQSFNFDGTNSVIIPSNSSLVSTNLTLGAWIYPTEYNTFLTNAVSRGGSYGIYLQSNGSLAFYIRGVNGMPAEIGSLTGYTFGGSQIELNKWTHVAFSYDGSRAKSYINGRLARTIVGVTGNVANPNDPLTIGGGAYNGKIDEVQYFSRALTEVEIRAIYDSDNQGICTSIATNRKLFDFDGDGKSDVSVFRPDNGAWYIQQSANGFTGSQFGIAADKLVPADYDGDGKTDIAVFRSGVWYLQRSNLGFTGVQFGDSNDIPQPADFDGDGKAELAVFRPSNGTWYVLNLVNSQFNAFQFGQNGDKPVAADYDGDGKADYAVNRNGTWYIQRSSLGFTGVQFGEASDKPVPADYDGDGKTDVAVFRPSNGVWYLLRSNLGFTGVQFGVGTDLPTPADYDGDGKSDIAVFRSGIWYLNRSTAGFTGVQFGTATDKPIQNAFVP